MNVKQLMSSPAVSCRSTDCLSTAAHRMWESDVGALPVVDAAGLVVGVITDRDICMAAGTQGRELSQIEVSLAMSREAHTCRPGDTLLQAGQIMRKHVVRRLPVVDHERRLSGMLSVNDLVRQVERELPSTEKDMQTAQLVATMAAICSPRRPLERPGGAELPSGVPRRDAR